MTRIAGAAAALTLASVLLLGVSGCGAGTSESNAAQAPLVRTVIVARARNPEVVYTGTVRARIEADLGFRLPGKITQRRVNPGARVTRGQVLMQIDPVDLELAAAAASQRFKAAAAEAERAAADEARLRTLARSGAESKTFYDAALAARRASAAALEAARSAMTQAGNQRAYASLAADSDGIVVDLLAQPGQVVAAGTPVIRLARAGPREALIDVPETALATLPRRGSATLYGSPARFPVRLREIAGSADAQTRTYAARYTLGGVGAKAPLGATVTVQLASATPATTAVPLAAILDAGGGPGVWVVRPSGRVTFRRVRIATLGNETVELADGIPAPGERIVALGANRLREGEAVRIAPPGS